MIQSPPCVQEKTYSKDGKDGKDGKDDQCLWSTLPMTDPLQLA